MAGTGGRRRSPAALIIVLGFLAGTFLLPFGWGVRAFRAPSGSMQPSVYAGDYVVVTKWSYGYGRYSFAPFPSPFNEGRALAFGAPRRGDIAVFRPEHQPDRDFLGRVIGLPGDRVQMIDGLLHLNGEPVSHTPLGEIALDDGIGGQIAGTIYRETPPDGASYTILDRYPDSELDNTREIEVPAGHYFVMGDDRDQSDDSRRSIGFVPLENFIGRVAWVIPSSPAERLP